MSKGLVFLCSGNGGNLRFTLNAINNKWINNWEEITVIADRECPAINYAREMGLDNFIVNFKEDNQIKLIELVLCLDPDLIITTVHSILLSQFLARFKSRLLNLHYSLLPSFAGRIGDKPVQEALEYGSRIIGITIHKVTAIIDGGQPQVQIALPIYEEESLEDVMDIIFRAGCIGLLIALKIHETCNQNPLSAGHVLIKNRIALINPMISYPEELNYNHFWGGIKL